MRPVPPKTVYLNIVDLPAKEAVSLNTWSTEDVIRTLVLRQ
jgi:hypothetical protein